LVTPSVPNIHLLWASAWLFYSSVLTDGFQDQGIVLDDEDVGMSTSKDSSWDSSEEEEEEESEGEDEECSKVEENVIIHLGGSDVYGA
jgi:hypothetical protein